MRWCVRKPHTTLAVRLCVLHFSFKLHKINEIHKFIHKCCIFDCFINFYEEKLGMLAVEVKMNNIAYMLYGRDKLHLSTVME